MTHLFSRKDAWIVSFILLVALVLRLYRIDAPIADWHSWRQVDTASVGRNFAEDGFDLLRPRFDDYSNVQTGSYNPEGLRFVEFPIYNATFAGLYSIAPFLSLEIWARIVTIVVSCLTIFCIYYLLLHEVSRASAIWGGVVYAVMPFFVFYSRVVLPDPIAIGMMWVSITLLYVWSKQRSFSRYRYVLYSGSLICASLAILIKPTTIFFLLPLAYIFLRTYTYTIFTQWHIIVYFLLIVTPFGLWRYWISLFPVGGPGFEWLITSVNTFEGQKIIFMRPAYFRWVYYERILLLIMGGWAGVSLLVGALRSLKRPWLLYSILASALIYLLTFQGGNVQHDYYQIMILPVLAMFAGMGFGHFFDAKALFAPRFVTFFACVGILSFSWILSYDKVKDMYATNGGLLNTARIIKTLTPSDALVVTDTTGDTTLLYNAHRAGMPAFADTLPELQKRGMEYFVTSNGGAIESVRKDHPEYKEVFSNSDVTIFKLTP